MIIRSLRRRVKKAQLEAVLNDPNLKICRTFQDLVEQYTDDDEPVRINPNQKCVWTPKYRKMMEELSKKMEEGENENDECDETREDPLLISPLPRGRHSRGLM